MRAVGDAGREAGRAAEREAGVVARTVRAVGPRVLRGLAVGAVACLPVAVLAGIVREQVGPVVSFDRDVIVAATDVTRAHPRLLDALVVWQEVFQPWHVYLAAALPAIWTWRRRHRGRAVWGVATMLVGWNLGLDVKLLVQRARPIVTEPVAHAPGYSFPSGHVFNVTMALAVCIVMTWPLVREARPAVRWAVFACAAALVVLTMLDRIFLGVHFPSDTVGGVLLAIALTTASWAGYCYRPRDRGAADR